MMRSSVAEKLCTHVSIVHMCVLLSVYSATFLVILPAMCQDLPFSWYFIGDVKSKDLKAKLIRQNEERLTAAKDYLLQLDTKVYFSPSGSQVAPPGVPTSHTDGGDIVISIVTMRRNVTTSSEGRSLGYLTQVAAAFHPLLLHDHWFGRKQLFICNVNVPPNNHTEAVQLSKHFHMVTKEVSDSTDANTTNTTAQAWDKYEQEKQDYVFCLEKAHAFGARFALMVQDDAIPKDDFFPALYHALMFKVRHPEARRGYMNAHARPWGCLKLFYPPRWQGYEAKLDKLLELCAIAVLGGCTFLGLVFLGSRKRPRRTISILYFCFGMIYSILVVESIGRRYILQLYGLCSFSYKVAKSPGCCIPAVVYPTQHLPEMIHHLNSVRCKKRLPVDVAIDQYFEGCQKPVYVMEPNLVNHVGLTSSLKPPKTNVADFIP